MIRIKALLLLFEINHQKEKKEQLSFVMPMYAHTLVQEKKISQKLVHFLLLSNGSGNLLNPQRKYKVKLKP